MWQSFIYIISIRSVNSDAKHVDEHSTLADDSLDDLNDIHTRSELTASKLKNSEVDTVGVKSSMKGDSTHSINELRGPEWRTPQYAIRKFDVCL